MHEATMSKLLRLSRDPVLILAHDGTVVHANERMRELLGAASASECEGKSLADLVEDDAEKVRDFLKACSRSGSLIPGSLTYRGADPEIGSTGCEGAVLTPKTDREAGRIFLRCTTASERRGQFTALNEKIEELASEVARRIVAEEELRSMNEKLERRVADRTSELNQTNEALVKTVEDLTEAQNQLVESEKMAALAGLVAGVAHEINTPVGIAVTAASHLDQKAEEFKENLAAGTLKRSELDRFIEVVDDACRLTLDNLSRAAKQIRSFKLVAVDQSSEQVREFNLKEYLEDVLLSLSPKLKSKNYNVSVTCPENLVLNSYPGAFSQILTNLVMNSITHGFEEQADGDIDIEVQRNNGDICIQYADSGKGVPEDLQPKIFDPFFTTKRGDGGSGLGLNILYNLVTQKLGGKVTCQNAKQGGIAFDIRVPAERNGKNGHE